MATSKYDLIVVGSGPGGYVAAIRASQLGMKVGVVERSELGGICLNWGCIPTKALLKSANVFEYIQHAQDYGINIKDASVDFKGMVSRSRDVAGAMSKGIQFLFKKNKIDVIDGFGKLKAGKKVEVENDGKKTDYAADHIILATGARSRELPTMPIDGKKIIGYRKAMTLEDRPKKMVVVGSGAIGIEFAYFYNTIGTDVTVVADPVGVGHAVHVQVTVDVCIVTDEQVIAGTEVRSADGAGRRSDRRRDQQGPRQVRPGGHLP